MDSSSLAGGLTSVIVCQVQLRELLSESGRAWGEHLGHARFSRGNWSRARGRRDWLQALLHPGPPAAPHCRLLSSSLHSCTHGAMRADLGLSWEGWGAQGGWGCWSWPEKAKAKSGEKEVAPSVRAHKGKKTRDCRIHPEAALDPLPSRADQKDLRASSLPYTQQGHRNPPLSPTHPPACTLHTRPYTDTLHTCYTHAHTLTLQHPYAAHTPMTCPTTLHYTHAIHPLRAPTTRPLIWTPHTARTPCTPPPSAPGSLHTTYPCLHAPPQLPRSFSPSSSRPLKWR